MGLLDDAIREHLDLKRRNGGDPGEIARKENEALTPVLEDTDGGEADDGAPAPFEHDASAGSEDAYADEHSREPEATYGSNSPEAEAGVADELAAPPAPEDFAPEGVVREEVAQEGFAPVGEETAELDMEAMLAEPGHPSDAPAPAAARPVRASALPESQEEDALEWEMPGERDRIPPEIPGQERLSFE